MIFTSYQMCAAFESHAHNVELYGGPAQAIDMARRWQPVRTGAGLNGSDWNAPQLEPALLPFRAFAPRPLLGAPPVPNKASNAALARASPLGVKTSDLFLFRGS